MLPERRPRPRQGRPPRERIVRFLLVALVLALVFLLGIAFARTLDERPEPGGVVTDVRTLTPLPQQRPGRTTTVTVTVTPYFFDQQEGRIPNRGMVLALPNEGTRIRHYEFYGASAPVDRRPFMRIVYGFPAPFETEGP